MEGTAVRAWTGNSNPGVRHLPSLVPGRLLCYQMVRLGSHLLVEPIYSPPTQPRRSSVRLYLLLDPFQKRSHQNLQPGIHST